MSKPSPELRVKPPVHRLASRLYKILSEARQPPASDDCLCGLIFRMQQLLRLQRRLTFARHRRFPSAFVRTTDELRELLQVLGPQVYRVISNVAAPTDQPAISLREITAEVASLDREFDDWCYQPASHALIVTTEPIVLKEIDLGRFEIRLFLKRLGIDHPAYEVVALEPNPAADNDEVTHPHVKEKCLCEGDATGAIANALAQGRVGEFFLLVNAVLHTYNDASPFISLNEWSGSSCHDCGYRSDSDDTLMCPGCGYSFCNDCSSYCRRCDQSRCSCCLEPCAACSEPTCQGCLELCKTCNQDCCTECLEEGICTTCIEKQQSKSSEGDGHDVAPDAEHDPEHDREHNPEHESECESHAATAPSPTGEPVQTQS